MSAGYSRQVIKALAAVVLACACTEGGQGSDEGAPRRDGGPSGSPGIQVGCKASREETTEDEPILDFSLADILDASVGEFHVPIRWESLCAENDAGASDCGDVPSIIERLAKTKTTANIRIRYANEPAIVRHPTSQQPGCLGSMIVPVVVAIAVDDGTIDGEWEAELRSNCGNEVVLNVDVPLTALSGGLADLAAEAPDGRFAVTIGFVADRMRFVLYVGSVSSVAFLTTDLPFGSDLDEVPRADVEQTAGVPLVRDNACSRKLSRIPF